MLRKLKKYIVIKSKFYINNPRDYGYKEKKLKQFNNITDAKNWIDDNIAKYIKNSDKNTCLQIIADYNDDKYYVIASYTL